MRKIEKCGNFLSYWSGELTKYLLIPMTILVLLEVFLRYLFKSPTIWIYELVEYLFGAMSLIGGAYCMRYKVHVNLSLIIDRLSQKVKIILEIFLLIIPIIYCLILLFKGFGYTWVAIKNLETSGTIWNPPIWPYAITLPFASFLLLVQAISEIIKNLYALIQIK